MNNYYLADEPVDKKSEDRFQRYEFSKRIAQTISGRDSNDSLVIGLYGAWGEGKTSVLNFIERELANDPNIIKMKFNPWRYNNEEVLIGNFLNKISSELNKEIKTKIEKAGELIGKYGGIGGFFNFDISNIGKSLAEVDLEDLKERVDGFLKTSNKKLVIIIDDIDRLDKQEIYSIFRLVKLNGYFNNTVYLLSFDEKMVAAAIGERFGEGNKDAGNNFLEKIVQVPLKIPKAQTSALQDYCFQIISKALKSSNIQLSEVEEMRFTKVFIENILLRLNTPRLAVRYGNSLTFALPLLVGEVNIVDLMLVESIKIFYPQYYDFIKTNSEFFIKPYSDIFYSSGKEEKKKDIKLLFEDLDKNLNKKENKSIKELLFELFPLLRSAYENKGYDDGSYENWAKSKRIVSQNYFERYFSYTVIDGDISDVVFEKFLDDVIKIGETDLGERIENIISKSSDDKFISRLNDVTDDLSWELGKKLSLSLTKNSNLFKDNRKDLSNNNANFSSMTYVAIFIFNIIKKNPDTSERLTLAKELIEKAKDLKFAYELNNWFGYGSSSEEKIFNNDQLKITFNILLKRIINESGSVPFFVKYYDDERALSYIFNNWAIVNKDELNLYISGVLNDSPKKVLDLIKAFTPSMVTNLRQGAFKTSLRAQDFFFIKNNLDYRYIFSKIQEAYGDELIDNIEEVIWGDFDIEQTDLNILRQFIHFYEKDSNDLNVSNQ